MDTGTDSTLVGAADSGAAEDPAAIVQKLKRLRNEERFDEGEPLISQAQQTFKNNFDIWFQSGALDFEAKRYDKAAKEFSQAASLSPHNVDALSYGIASRVASLRSQGLHEKAEQLARQELASNKRYAPVWRQLGAVYLDTRQYDLALQAFKKARRLTPLNTYAWAQSVTCLRLTHRFPEAEKMIAEVPPPAREDPELFLQRGYLRFDQGQYEDAAAELARAVERKPGDDRASAWRAAALRRAGRYEDAEKVLADALQLRPKSAKLVLERALLNGARERHDKAQRDFRRATSLDPRNEYGWVSWVSALRLRGHVDEAKKVLDQAKRHGLDGASLWKESGFLRFDQHDNDAALAAFEEALKRDPRDDIALTWRVEVLRQLRRFPEAEQRLREAVSQRPDSAKLMTEQGFLAQDRKDQRQAVEHFNRSLSIDDTDPDAWSGKASALHLEGNRVAAKDAAEAGLKRCPNGEQLMNRLGLIHIDERDFSKARTAFATALQVAPNNEVALAFTVAAFRMEGKPTEAWQVLDEALQRLPNSLYLLKERSFLFLDQGQFEQARATLARSLEIDPDDEDALVAMINALDGEHPEDAMLFADKALERLPNSAALRATRGWLAYARNNLAHADEEFKAAFKIDPNNPSAVNGVGATYLSQADYDEAVARFRRVVQLIPADCVAYTNLASALTKQAEKRDGQPPGPTATDNLEEAEQLCRTALSLRGGHAPAWRSLGLIAYKRGQILRAEEFLKRSVREDAKDGGHGTLGALYVQMGAYAEAEKYLNQAIALNPGDLTNRLELGGLCLLTDRIKEAIVAYRGAVAVDPASELPYCELAKALIRGKDLVEAERVLQNAIARLDERHHWRLHATLARVLIEIGGTRKPSEFFYKKALDEARFAIRCNSKEGEPYFYEALALYRLKQYEAASESFKLCDPNNLAARRNRSSSILGLKKHM